MVDRSGWLVRVAVVACAATALCMLCVAWSPAVAAPHTISRADHPFDPDWLEVKLVLQRKCLGCHLARTEQADLSSYEAVLAAKSGDTPFVVPGRPDESLLWESVAWNVQAQADSPFADSPAMPEERSEWLTLGQLHTLYRWIENGALEYRLPDHCNTRPLLESDFPSAKQCASCHPRQYDQWSRSMHAYAQHSPIFEAFNLTLVERTGGTIGTFCTRCHTPIGTTLGENGSRRNVHRSRISREGITCVVCHRQARPQHKNNGRIQVEPGDMFDTCVYGPFEGSTSSALGSHPSSGPSHIRTSQFCGNCHDVVSPEGVRLEEAFSEWQNSPAAKDGIRCHDCHMGPVQGVPVAEKMRPLGRAAVVPGVDPERLPLRHLSDHTFAGPDYSLLPDTEFPHKLDWMYEIDYRDPTRLTPYQQRTLVELRRANRKSLRTADEKRYELLGNAARLEVRHPREARYEEKVRIDVDVASLVAGHSFPTGFTAERQVWVSVEVLDPQGEAVFLSGDLDRNGDLRDSHSHDVLTGHLHYDRHLLNLQNKFVVLTNKGTERTAVLSVNRDLRPLNVVRPATGLSSSFGRPQVFRIAKGSLPPLGKLGRKYPVRLDSGCGLYTLRVQLNFRHLPPTLLDHIGTPHLKHLLEVVVIDSYEGVIEVSL